MVPVVPVPQPVVDDPGPDGLVVAFPQVIEQLRVQAGVAAGAGLIHVLVCLAQDRDDVACPGLQAAGAELGDGAAAADDVGAALLDAGEWPGQQVLVSRVAVGVSDPVNAAGIPAAISSCRTRWPAARS